jgi:hypothetical protein
VGEVLSALGSVAGLVDSAVRGEAVTHAETKAAVWAANGKQFVDVVTNRTFVCGEEYRPGNRFFPPGCAQAVAAVLPAGYRMRVRRRGVAVPFVIVGRAKRG